MGVVEEDCTEPNQLNRLESEGTPPKEDVVLEKRGIRGMGSRVSVLMKARSTAPSFGLGKTPFVRYAKQVPVRGAQSTGESEPQTVEEEEAGWTYSTKKKGIIIETYLQAPGTRTQLPAPSLRFANEATTTKTKTKDTAFTIEI